MPKEIAFSNAASVESSSSTTEKSPDAIGRSGSTSSAKYRVSSRPNSVVMQSPTEVIDPQRSHESRVSTANGSSMLQRMNKNSASRLSSTEPSAADGSTTAISGKSKSRFAIATDAAATLKVPGATPKLPQKLRQHVTRLRNQFALGSGVSSGSSRNLSVGGRSPSPTNSPHKVARPSMTAAAINSRRFSIAAAAAIQHSRRSNQQQQLQATKEKEQDAPKIEALKTPASSQDPEPVMNTATFQNLLRPLQTSLSCASITTGWSSDEDDDAEQRFRLSERENSRMLRVCCSIDNLMLSIGDRAQEQKQTEAIVRNATRDLVQLYQYAMKQVVSVIFDKCEDPSGNNKSIPHDATDRIATVKMSGKEAQYAMEFLLEINERFGKVYEFVRSVFVSEVDGLRLRIKELEKEILAATSKNEQLQNEMRDLRDFQEENNVSAVDSFGIGTSSNRNIELDSNGTAAMAAFEVPDVSTAPGVDESSALQHQCQELSRLLEMAKQEIRLSHHERDVQKARVAEISNALFHDSELGFLRNQLQSEKKRVRVLERENMTLRESQQEQSLKLQSLETLQPAVSTATTNAIRRTSTILRPPIESNPPSLQHDRAESHNVSAEEAPPMQLTIETEDNQYNFISSVAGDAEAVTSTNWFSCIVNIQQATNVRRSRKKQLDAKPEQPPVVLSKFLTGLLMTDKQLVTAKAESTVRRQANVPTIGSINGALSARRDARSAENSNSRKATDRKRRSRSAGLITAPANNTETEDSREEILTGCIQLVWTFYQRFLLAVEAQSLLETRGIAGDPTMGSGISCSAGNPTTEPVSLSLIIFHFFLERCSRERDAVQELETFVRCAHRVRNDSYSLELFCRFMEETCSRQELCFFLWVCQAVDDIRLGISYDDPLPSHPDGSVGFYDSHSTQFMCVLKATFLARTIFRVLHFKVLCRPSTKGGRRRGKGKRTPQKRRSSISAVAVTPSSPSPSPKRKPRTRLGEVAVALEVSADPVHAGNNAAASLDEQKRIPPYIAAQTELREIIESNQDEPITLEVFNNLLLKFAVVPSPEELTARLGPFYQPTGEERKIPTDVFLALLMEAYKFQLQWQRDQLRALLIHLNHQEDLQQRAAEKLAKAAAATGENSKRQGEEKKTLKSKMKKRRSRDGSSENGVEGSKYLQGLSRSVLRELLLQAEIVHDGDMAQIDVDWLFAQLVHAAGGSAANITFDSLFDALQKMRWLDSSKLRVDALMEMSGMGSLASTKKSVDSGQTVGTNRLSKARTSAVVIPSPIVRAVSNNWRVYARHSVALCNNDPNLFVRRHSQRLLHYVDQHLVKFANGLENGDTTDVGMDAINCIREFLAFAWRVAAKRSGGKGVKPLSQACLTEVFLVSQALRTTVDPLSGYQWQAEAAEPQVSGNLDLLQLNSSRSTRDTLQRFYDISRMNLKPFVRDRDSNKVTLQLHELENVLLIYASHIAHLFERHSEARFNCAPQVSFDRWRAMLYELDLVHPRTLPFVKLQSLFISVIEAPFPLVAETTEVPLDQELGVGKTQFSELFVLIAIERHRDTVARQLEKAQAREIKKAGGFQVDNKEALLEAAEIADRPARIMAVFCRDVLALRAFKGDNALVERNFAAKLSCPLVGRALLEHRAFLRTVFFYYAKQDEIAEDERTALQEQALIREMQENGGQILEALRGKAPASSAPDADTALQQSDSGTDFQLEKTKRSSMSFGEFQTFLTAFGLLDTPELTDDHRQALRKGAKVALADAQHVFSTVMSLDNDDTLQLEFDEFAAAVVALAVHLNPSPFTLWHQKLDDFATRLQRMWETQNQTNRKAC